MIQVGNFGIHWASGGVAFLEQDETSNATGVDLDSPFKVVPTKRGAHCPHAIDLRQSSLTDEEQERMIPLLEDPLVDAMLPLPRTDDNRMFFFDASDRRLSGLLMTLTRMSSPIRPIIAPIWSGSFNLSVTNVAPLVIVDADPTKTKLINTLNNTARYGCRTVVLTGRPDIALSPDFERRSTNLTPDGLRELPWERFGAWMVKRYMRCESLNQGQGVRRSLMAHL